MISPKKVAYYAKKNEKKNYQFRTWLKIHADPDEFDLLCHRLHRELFAEYDYSRCRNCCKQYHGLIPAQDIERDAAYLSLTEEEFRQRFLAKEQESGENAYNTKSKPCDFLQEDGQCLLDEFKPESCKKYPYTDQPDRIGSLLSFLDNISICPVAYEIWERLKAEYGFRG